MHTNTEAGADVIVDGDGFFRVDVIVFHKPAWCIGANGDQCHVHRPQALKGFLELHTVVAGVTAEPQAEIRQIQAPGGPQGLITVGEPAAGPMLGGCGIRRGEATCVLW